MDRRLALAVAHATLAAATGWAATGCASSSPRPTLDRFGEGRPDARAPAAAAHLSRVDAAIRRYAAEHGGRLPTTLDDLTTQAGPDGEVYLRRLDRDPWGQSYDYALESARAGTYDLRSFGPDRLPGTADDVVVRGVVPRP